MGMRLCIRSELISFLRSVDIPVTFGKGYLEWLRTIDTNRLSVMLSQFDEIRSDPLVIGGLAIAARWVVIAMQIWFLS